jgi:hypothetical protein
VSVKDEPARPALRLVKAPAPKPKRYEPDSEVKAMFDEIRCQQDERRRAREWCDPGGKDAG